MEVQSRRTLLSVPCRKNMSTSAEVATAKTGGGKINPNTISEVDRNLVLEFTNALRDMDTARFLSSSAESIETINRRIDPHITRSFRALVKLEQSDNLALRELAGHAANKSGKAIKKLRQLGNLLKQESVPDKSGKERTWHQDPLNNH